MATTMGRRPREDNSQPGGPSKKPRGSTPIEVSDNDTSPVKQKPKTRKKAKAKVVVTDSDGDDDGSQVVKKKTTTRKKSTAKSSARTVRKKQAQKTTLDLGNPAATENDRLCLVFDHALHIHREFDLPAKVKTLEESLLVAESKATVSELELKRLEKERTALAAQLQVAATQLDEATDRINEAEAKAAEAERDLTRMLQRLAPPAPAVPRRDDRYMRAPLHERNTPHRYRQVFDGADQDYMPRDSQGASASRLRSNENYNRGGYTRRVPARMPLHDQNYTDAQDFDDTNDGAACYDEDYPMHD